MLERYRDIEVCKEDINSFIELTKEDVAGVPEIQIRSISKGLIFFKRIFMQNEVGYTHYSECLISDALNLIHSLGIRSQRLYYMTYRSLIENFVRVLLRYGDFNDNGVRNMFKDLRNEYGNMGTDFINYIEGEYGKCCNVIHSNAKAKLNLYLYYEELVHADEMDQKTVDSCINTFCTFCNKAKEFMVENMSQSINENFYNHKELLAFLVGEKNYARLEKKWFE